MGFLTALKTPFLGFVLIVSYVNWVLSAVMLSKAEEVYHTYPPASVALLVAGVCQSLHLVGYFVFGKSKIYALGTHQLWNLFDVCFTFASVVALTVKRHDHARRYCEPGPALAGECAGVMRGNMAIGWCAVGFTILYMLFLAALQRSTRSSSATPLGKVGEVERIVYDEEKPPARH